MASNPGATPPKEYWLCVPLALPDFCQCSEVEGMINFIPVPSVGSGTISISTPPYVGFPLLRFCGSLRQKKDEGGPALARVMIAPAPITAAPMSNAATAFWPRVLTERANQTPANDSDRNISRPAIAVRVELCAMLWAIDSFPGDPLSGVFANAERNSRKLLCEICSRPSVALLSGMTTRLV